MSTATHPIPTPALLTAEEFVRQYSECRADLVRGVIVEKPMPGSKHGKVANWVAFYLTQHVLSNDLGHVMTNDTSVIVERNPDTARGADVLFISYARLPKGTVPDGPLAVPPDLVVEVRSPSDRWPEILEKISEYLNAGVGVVVVLDPKSQSVSTYRPEERPHVFETGDDLTLPDLLPGFSVPVSRFFA